MEVATQTKVQGLGHKAGVEIELVITIADDSTFQRPKSVILGSYDST